MGAYSPLPWAPAGLADEVVARDRAADGRGDGAPRHPVQRPALRRARAHLGRAEGRRVQRPLRRSRDPGRPRPARRARSPSCSRGDAPTWSTDSAVTVVVAAPGYPDVPQLGGEITGLEAAAAVPGASVAARRDAPAGQRAARRHGRPGARGHRTGCGPVRCARMCVRGRPAHPHRGRPARPHRHCSEPLLSAAAAPAAG